MHSKLFASASALAVTVTIAACGGIADPGPSLSGKGDMVSDSTRLVYAGGKEIIHVGNSSSPSSMFLLTLSPAAPIEADLLVGSGLGWVNTVATEMTLMGAICNGAHTTLELANPGAQAVEVALEQVELDCSQVDPAGEQGQLCTGIATQLGIGGSDPCAGSDGKEIRLLTATGDIIMPAETRPYEDCGIGARACGRGCQYALTCDDL